MADETQPPSIPAPIETTPAALKPGWKTTEFWLATVATVVSVLTMSGIISTGSMMDKIIGLLGGVLASLGYSVSRGLAKKA